ncbi:MAG: radical SAM protein [Desulfovibrionaceae bacterium]|nr:radical SAM protein [Desulfovibrionaceae bacterium]
MGSDPASRVPCDAFDPKLLSAPIMINLELTSGCNMKCRHCYNFWRGEDAAPAAGLEPRDIDLLAEKILAEGVFHVVLTGGEPLLRFDTLVYALKRFTEAGLSTSVNSNLMLLTAGKAARLRDAGLDHVLTSLNSRHAETNDYMVNSKGALEKIKRGVKTARAADIRVSVNMIVSEPNKDHVYETGRLCAELGAQRLFATRLVPSVRVKDVRATDLRLEKRAAREVLAQILAVKRDFGIGVGTLISYPLCFLEDLELYEDFVGRGCPAQRGNRMCVGADGSARACTHEERSYGNVFTQGIGEVFQAMRAWRDGGYLHGECAGCAYLGVCASGCRSAAYAYFGELSGPDPLFEGVGGVRKPYKPVLPGAILRAIDAGERFVAPERIRFRQEDGFTTVNVRWANAFALDSGLAAFLREKQRTGESFCLADLRSNDPRRDLAILIFKDAVEPLDASLRASISGAVAKGCSLDPSLLPGLEIAEAP